MIDGRAFFLTLKDIESAPGYSPGSMIGIMRKVDKKNGLFNLFFTKFF